MAERIKLLVASVTQTGDIPHIAGALALRPKLNALVLYDAGVDIALLKELYQRAASIPKDGSKDRVDFLSVPSSLEVQEPQKSLYNTLKTCNNLFTPTAKQTDTFKTVLGNDAYVAFKNKYLVPNSENRPKFAVLKLTEATGLIATAYRVDRINSYKSAAQGLIFDPARLPIESIIKGDKFGTVNLPPTGNDVLLVWARYTGTKTDTGFNPEGDSDPTGQNQLVASATKLGFSVITVGDVPSPGMTTVVNGAKFQLGEFWTQAPLADKGRAGQCSFFAALMERYPGRLYQIGQKTGAMDFPALLGIPTIYIEDSKISTAATGRMRQWTKPDSLQLYRRLEVMDPPSLPGKGARSFTETFIDDEEGAIKERRLIGEAKWRMTGLLSKFPGQWTNITDLAKVPIAFSDICDVVNGATPEKLQAWKTKINALSDKDCEIEGCIRGYTEDDLITIENELTKMRTEYGGKMIIRKPGGIYTTRPG